MAASPGSGTALAELGGKVWFRVRLRLNLGYAWHKTALSQHENKRKFLPMRKFSAVSIVNDCSDTALPYFICQ